jgi:hypothetical protein
LPLRLTTRDLFAALPAVSALTLGALYTLGVFLTVSQLVGAHVPASQALPLIPLQDHLAKGLAAVFTSPLVSIWATAAFLALLFGYASSRSFERRAKAADALLDEARAQAEALVTGWRGEGEQIAADLDALEKELQDAAPQSNDPQLLAFKIALTNSGRAARRTRRAPHH